MDVIVLSYGFAMGVLYCYRVLWLSHGATIVFFCIPDGCHTEFLNIDNISLWLFYCVLMRVLWLFFWVLMVCRWLSCRVLVFQDIQDNHKTNQGNHKT